MALCKRGIIRHQTITQELRIYLHCQSVRSESRRSHEQRSRPVVCVCVCWPLSSAEAQPPERAHASELSRIIGGSVATTAAGAEATSRVGDIAPKPANPVSQGRIRENPE